MLRAYVPGLTLSASVVAAAAVAYAAAGGEHGAPRPARLADGPRGLALRIPSAQAPPRRARHRVGVAVQVRTGLPLAVFGGGSGPSAGVLRTTGSGGISGVARNAGGRNPRPRASVHPVTPAPVPVAAATPVPAQATPADDPVKVREPEVAVQPDPPTSGAEPGHDRHMQGGDGTGGEDG